MAVDPKRTKGVSATQEEEGKLKITFFNSGDLSQKEIGTLILNLCSIYLRTQDTGKLEIEKKGEDDYNPTDTITFLVSLKKKNSFEDLFGKKEATRSKHDQEYDEALGDEEKLAKLLGGDWLKK